MRKERDVLRQGYMFLLLLLTILGCGGSRSDYTISASGTIEAREVEISSRIAGKVEFLGISEGEEVKKGQVIARIDVKELRLQLEGAKANEKMASVKLEQARMLRDLAAKQAEIQIRQAEAGLEAAIARLHQAKELLKLQNAQIGPTLEGAEAALIQAEKRLEALRKGAREEEKESARVTSLGNKVAMEEAERELERAKRLFEAGAISKQQLEAAETRFLIAKYQYEFSRQSLNLVLKGPREEDIEAAMAAVKGAEAALALAKSSEIQNRIREAELELAKANLSSAREALELARTGTIQISLKEKDIELARSQLAQARASIELIETQISNSIIRSPMNGTVVEKVVEEGENVLPGMPLAVISDLSKVYLKVYLSPKEIGRIRIGDAVRVFVDSAPRRGFPGRIVHISSQAEFTPKNIQTKEERERLVFAVKVEIDNPEGILKPGMPADVEINLSRLIR